MKKIFGMALVSLSLTGCAPMLVADAVFLAGKALDPNPIIKLYAKHAIEPKQGQKVYAAKVAQFVTGFIIRSTSGCEGTALVVDYARDWDVLDEETGEVIHKAQPDKIYSQAVLVYRYSCKGKPTENVLLTTDRVGKILLKFSSDRLKKSEALFTKNWFKIGEDLKPRWMPQVIKTIQAEAATNPAAQDFLDSVQIGEDGLPVKPEISEDTQKE